MIPHNRVITTQADIDAVSRVIASDYIGTNGPEVEKLEHEMCEFIARRYGICVASGLAAIRLSFLAYRDLLPVIPAYGCVSAINAVHSRVEKVGIADVLPDEWNIDPDDLGHQLDPEAVLAIHTFGVPADIKRLMSTGAVVIEDCTHGFGRHDADVEILSFGATKLVGGAAGGIVLTDNAQVAETVRYYRHHDDKPASGLRLNDAMTDVHAALVRSKLKRLPSLIAEREEIAQLYIRELQDTPSIKLPVMGNRTWYRFVIETPDAEYYCRRLEQLGIRAEMPVWNWLEEGRNSVPVSMRAYSRLVSLPCYPGLKKEEITYIACCVRGIAGDIKEKAA